MSDELRKREAFETNLTDLDMLELEMACNRGGNDWLETLEEFGCRLLHDAQELRYLARALSIDLKPSP